MVATPPPTAEGTYEPQVKGLSPAFYLKFGGNAADSSGNGRNGTLGGTGGSFGATSLAPNVGSLNTAFDTEGTAFVTVPHAAVDTARTAPSDWQTEQSTDGYRFIAEVTISCWFNLQVAPTGSNKAVIFSKSHTATPGTADSYAESHPVTAPSGTTVAGGSFEAYVDSSGALHVEVRSFRGRPARVRTPNGTISTGVAYHLAVQLGYDGVAAWLNGAKFEDGYGNLLHVHGLAANIRNTTFRNNYAWMLGKAAWGGQADVIIDEFAVYNRAPSATLAQANVNTLAQQGSTPAPLPHFVWGALTVNRSSYASINAAITDVKNSGGGTVLINPGTYSENVTLQSTVRLKANGGTVNINGWCRTTLLSLSTITDNATDFLTADRNLDVSNSRAVGDTVTVLGAAGNPSPLRLDRRWNLAGEGNDPSHPDAESFDIESRTGSDMTFTGVGSTFDFAASQRQSIRAFTPHMWMALEGDLRFTAAGGSGLGTDVVEFDYSKHVRIVGIRVTNTAAAGQGLIFQEFSMFGQVRGCIINLSTARPQVDNGGYKAIRGAKDCVFKDSHVVAGQHCCDVAGNQVTGPGVRIEYHKITWDQTVKSGTAAAYGAHGTSVDCLYWNLNSNWGGPAATGWKHDLRWAVCGDAAVAASGWIGLADGAGDVWYRDILVVRPRAWFTAFENVIRVSRCHFRNVKWSQPPTGVSHDARYRYSTGADVNTYNNVDGAHANWQAV